MKRSVYLVLSIFMAHSFYSCSSLGASQTGNHNLVLNSVQSILRDGTQEGYDVFNNPEAFMTNALIEEAMPEKLKEINGKLESMGLIQIVEKEKQLISNVAQTTISTTKPIIQNAINSMTTEDAIGLISGGKGAATNYLKTQTYNDIIVAITPLVTEKLESLGVNNLLSNALGDGQSTVNTILGMVVGNTTSKEVTNTANYLNEAITTQLVDGLFNVVRNVENKTRENPSAIINTVFGK